MEALKTPKTHSIRKNSNTKNFLNKILGFVQPTKSKKESIDVSKEDFVLIAPVASDVAVESTSAKKFDEQLEADLNIIDNISKFLKETEMLDKVEICQEENLQQVNQDTTIDDLPIEIICKIIDYLEFNERKNASLVCKKWRNAFLESYYLKDIMVKANNHLFVSNRPLSASVNKLPPLNLSHSKHRAASSMALHSYSTKSNFNFQLYNNLVNLEFENDSADVNLLLKNLKSSSTSANLVLPKLKNLKFNKTTMSSKTLIELLDQAPKLEKLSLIQCDSLFMSGFLAYTQSTNKDFNLANLKELSLSKNRYLTDFLINLFLNSIDQLESLDISFCSLTKTNFKSISNKNSYLSNNQDSIFGSTVVLTVENLLKQPVNLKHIKSLNLSGIEIFCHEEEFLISLVEMMPNLTEIYLSNLPNMKVETIFRLFEKVPNLKSIDLNGSIQFNELRQLSIESCLEKSKNLHADFTSRLEVLKLNKAKISNSNLFSESIAYFTRLTYLDLSCMMFQRSFGTPSRLSEFIENLAQNLSKCDKLETLKVSYCDTMVNDAFIKVISKKLLNLKHLDLRNCSQITDQSLHYISTFLTKLVYLDLSWCQNISDYGLDKSIEFGRSKKLLNEFNKHLNGACRCIKKYTEQPFLLLKTKNEINAEIKRQFCNCIGVSYEDANETIEVRSSELSSLSDKEIPMDVSLKNLRYLRVLKLESCVNISDIGLYNGMNLTQLNELDIKLCTNVNGDFIYSYLKDQINNSRKLFNNLKVLNLNQCIKFKEENLIFILEGSPNLRELSISALSLISNQIIETLLKIRKLLVLFDISFCSNINESQVEKYEQFLYNEFGLREFFLDKRFISK